MLTDHKPLTYALASHSDKYTPRQVRHLDFISQFTSDICHVTGVGNAPADALSRIEVNAVQRRGPPAIDFDAMASAQASEESFRHYSPPPPHSSSLLFHSLHPRLLSSVI